MKKLIAGNWKMNGNLETAVNLSRSIVEQAGDVSGNSDLLLCPPAVYITRVLDICRDSFVAVGGQDCSSYQSGAYTGEISAAMLEDTGCRYVILGHSERRQYHNETSALVSEKAAIAHQHNLNAIICLGENEQEREQSLEKDIVGAQLEESLPPAVTAKNTIIAYEPVWAIGTGKTATPEDVADMHQFIREKLQEKLADSSAIRILYGGSVKPDNAQELFKVPNVDGALIGGASLKAEQFLAIAAAT